MWCAGGGARPRPAGAVLAETGPAASLEELAGLTAETVDWRCSPESRTVVAYPARLRRGGAVKEGGVRVVQGCVMLDLYALAELTGKPVGTQEGTRAELAGGEATQAWVPLAALAERWRLHWSAEEWEAAVETP